jgi:hypothetical protein
VKKQSFNENNDYDQNKENLFNDSSDLPKKPFEPVDYNINYEYNFNYDDIYKNPNENENNNEKLRTKNVYLKQKTDDLKEETDENKKQIDEEENYDIDLNKKEIKDEEKPKKNLENYNNYYRNLNYWHYYWHWHNYYHQLYHQHYYYHNYYNNLQQQQKEKEKEENHLNPSNKLIDNNDDFNNNNTGIINKPVVIENKKIEEKKIEKIIDNLILVTDKDRILSFTHALITFINETNVKQEEYTAIINIIKESSNGNLEIEYINMCLEILNSLGIDLNDKRKENCFPNVLMELTKKPEIIQFLLNKKYEDCRLLKEIVNNNNDNILTTADIVDFEKCVEFMNKIGSPEQLKNMTDCDLVQKAISLCDNYIELEIYLDNFIEHFEQIKKLIKKDLDKSQSSNQKN